MRRNVYVRKFVFLEYVHTFLEYVHTSRGANMRTKKKKFMYIHVKFQVQVYTHLYMYRKCVHMYICTSRISAYI